MKNPFAPLTRLSAGLALVLLAGCGPSQEDARKLGFQTVEEMKSIQGMGYKNKQEYDDRYKVLGFDSLEHMDEMNKRGYQSMQDYKNVRALGPNFFYKNCKSADESTYNLNCKGKRISWLGEIRSADTSYGANITVLNDDGTELEKSFSIDSKSIAAKISKSDEGRRIEFEGLIGAKNVVSPDIESVRYIKLESDAERESRREKQKQAQAQKEEADAREFAQLLETHGSDAKWLDTKYGIAAALACSSGADDFLRSTSKYAFKWDDTGWLDTKFDSYFTKVHTPGVITYTSNKASLQNGFGAYQRMKMACDYDVRKKKVVRYDIL